ncbi:MAG: threonine synthase [Chloroflexota bacterium]|nr:MAG: threonine synthase [Chloroflexota bacterium]
MKQGLIGKYRAYLPVTGSTPVITLGEGDTPLVHAARLGREIGCDQLFLKLEGCNPTGSFKDRGMVLALAKAMEAGSTTVICASTGNTSSSAAAYAAHAGLRAVVIIPHGYVALGKLTQVLVHGAVVLSVNGNFDEALASARSLADSYPVTLVNSINPFRLEGQKTAAFEVVDELGDAPDYLCIPVGNAGNITAYWRGFREYKAAGKAQRTPHMMGFEALGAAPIVNDRVITKPATVATAIRIGNPVNWQNAVRARDESGGTIQAVSDEEIIKAYQTLAATEGVFAEPASAASVAGLLKLHREGLDFSGKRVVCVLTGNGLKDPDAAIAHSPRPIEVSADPAAIREVLGWE